MKKKKQPSRRGKIKAEGRYGLRERDGTVHKFAPPGLSYANALTVRRNWGKTIPLNGPYTIIPRSSAAKGGRGK